MVVDDSLTDPQSDVPLPLSELWRLLDQVLRHPEDLESSTLLQVLDQAIAPLPLAEQLAVAGLVFDQLAGVVKTRATLLLESWASWHRPADPLLDFSRDPELFVQSQRLELTDLVLTTPEPMFYPFERKSPTSPDSAFDEAGGGEGESLGDDLSDLFPPAGAAHVLITNLEAASKADVMASIKALSHGENIPLWSAQVAEAMRSLMCAEHVSQTGNQRHLVKALPLLALQETLQVPLVEVWLALLLGESGYQLSRIESEELPDFKDWSDAFYSSAALQVSVVE